MKLLKLELKKTGFQGYLWASLWIFTAVLAMGIVFSLIPILDTLDGTQTPAQELWMFSTWRGLSILISCISVVCFSILASVIAGRVIVAAYSGRTASLLFSYPVSRQRILGVKVCLTAGFTVAAAFVCIVAATLILAGLSRIFGLVPEAFDGGILGQVLKAAAVLAVLAASVGVIAAAVGLWKKSVPASIVTGVLLVCPLSNLFVTAAEHSILAMTAVMAAGAAAAAVAYGRLAKRIRHMEV